MAICIAGAFYKWSPESIQLLLSLYVDSKDKFSSPVLRKATVWAEIAKQLNQHGYDVTVIQVVSSLH